MHIFVSNFLGFKKADFHKITLDLFSRFANHTHLKN